MKRNEKYYQEVAEYYDQDAGHFESRYDVNPLLQRIRNDFRTYVDAHPSGAILEVGYGPGLDLIYFAGRNTDAQIYGVDVSAGMYDQASKNIRDSGLANIRIDVGSVEDIEQKFPGKQFDMIYVFFGALNTVDSLPKAAEEINRLLKPGGTAVLTFVNKWYLRGFIVPFLKGRFKTAFARFRSIWGGYSTRYFLPSRCYSRGEVKNAFKAFELVQSRGYSILFPAWYDAHKYRNPASLDRLWSIDERIGKTFAKGWGEYTLFVFRKPR